MTEPTQPAHRRSALLAIALAGLWALGCATALAGTLSPGFDLTFSPSTIGPDSTSVARFTITNGSGSAGITDLSFSNTLPAGLVIADAPGLATDCVNGLLQGSTGGSTILFEQGRLSAGSTCSVEVNVTGFTPGTYVNVSGGLSSSAGTSTPASANLTIDDRRVGFSKSFSPATVRLGERSRLTFLLDATLVGSNSFNVAFSDRLPEGMVLAVPANASTDCVGSLSITPGSPIIQFFGGFLAPGQQCSIGVDVIGETIGPIENLSADLNSTAGISGKSSATLEVIGSEVNLRHRYEPNPARAGESVDLVLTLQNTNRSLDAEQLSFSLDLGSVLPGLAAVGLPLIDPCGSGSTVTGAGVIALNGGQLLPDDACSFSVPVQIPAGVSPGAYSSITSSLTGQVGGSPITTPPSTQTLFVNATPILTKAFLNNPVGAGDVATVEFTLTNPSATEPATEVGFTDNLTLFMTESSLVAPQSNFCNGTGSLGQFGIAEERVLRVSNITLAPGASCTFTADLQIGAGAAPGTYTNVTSPVSATSGGVTSPGGFATAELDVAAAPRLAVRFIDDPVLPGGTATVEYRLSYPEEAASPATNISFNHDLAAALPGLAAIGLPATDLCGPGSQLSGTGNLVFSGGALDPGASCTFSVSVQVPAAAPPADYPVPTSVPTAQVGMISTTGLAASDTLRVAVVEFSKSFIDDPVLPGQAVTLRYTIENTGLGTLSAGFFTENPNALIPGMAALAPLPASPCGAGSAISGTTFLIVTGLTLAPGTSCSFEVSLLVPAGAVPGAYSSLTSSLSGQYDGSPVVIPPAADLLEIQALSAPSLSKAFVDDPVQPGDAVTLEFTLSNPDGVDGMTNLAFVDDLDVVLSGLVATGLPASNVCGSGSALTGTSSLTLTGGSLAPGASCTFSVSLQVPSSAAPGEYLNRTSGPAATISGQTVTGVPATDRLQVTVLEASKNFSNPGVTGSTTTLSYTLSNPGSSRIEAIALTDDLDTALPGLTAVGLPLTDVCGSGSSLSGSSLLVLSGASLAAGASCSFDVTVSIPAAALPGIYPSTTSPLTAAGLIIGTPAAADLQVVGVPALTISPTTTDFGMVRVGTPSAAQSVTLENTGNDVLTVAALSAPSTPFARIGGSCVAPPFSLAASGRCTLTYAFTPTATGAASQTIDVQSDAPSTPDAFALIGTGIQSALALNPNPVDFGAIRIGTTSAARSITVSNPGTAVLNVLFVDPISGGPFAEAGGSCGAAPFTVAPGGACTLAYDYSPVAPGTDTLALSVTSDAPGSPSTLNLTGMGIESALVLAPNPLDFGDVGIGTSNTRTVTLSNPGSAALNVSALEAPSAPFAAMGGSCGNPPFTVAVGSACTLEYRVSPIAVGPAQNDLQLTSDAPSSPDTLGLRVNGTPPSVVLSPNPLDFGDVGIGGVSPTLSVTVDNPSAAVLDVASVTGPTPPFSAAGGSCGGAPFSVAPGSTCTLDYRFSPTTVGPAQVDLQWVSNATTSPDTLSLVGNGTPPVLTLESDEINFGPVPVTTLAERSLLLTNGAAGILVIDGISSPAAPFEVDAGSCGAPPITLTAGQSCSLVVGFSPSAIVAFESTFEISSNDANSPQRVRLRGVGQPLVIPSLNAVGLPVLFVLLALVGLVSVRRRFSGS